MISLTKELKYCGVLLMVALEVASTSGSRVVSKLAVTGICSFDDVRPLE